MTNDVTMRVSTADVSGLVLRMATDLLIRTQPGVYSLPHPDGGEVWICPFGSGKSPRVLRTSPGLTETSQIVEVGAPDGSVRRYAVTVLIKEITDEQRAIDDGPPAGGDLPGADRAAASDAEAAPEDGSQIP